MIVEELSVKYIISGIPYGKESTILNCVFSNFKEFVAFSELLENHAECRQIDFEISGLIDRTQQNNKKI